jgi:hypothetical protein
MSNSYYRPNIDIAKAAATSNYLSRPTIQWKLSCEATGETRQKVYDMVKDSSQSNDDAENSNARTVKNSVMWGFLIITIPCMLMTCCGTFFFAASHGTFWYLLVVPIIINLVTQIVCASVIVAKA